MMRKLINQRLRISNSDSRKETAMFAYINTGLCFLFTILFFLVRNRPNGVCGIRVTYTLEHPDIWKKTHLAAFIAAIPCCLLDGYALWQLSYDTLLILSWIGLFFPIVTGCIVAAILGNRQDKMDDAWEEQQRKEAERQESFPHH